MNYLRKLGLAAIGPMALMAIAAGSASATTLEIKGVAQNKAVAFQMSAAGGGGAWILSDTEGAQANTCSVSSLKGTTSVFTGSKVTGSLSEFSLKTCTRESVVVDAAGGLLIEHDPGTTNGKAFWENFSITVPTSFGFNVTCASASPILIAYLIGVITGMALNAVLSCGFLLPSATLKGSYKLSSPEGLGVVA